MKIFSTIKGVTTFVWKKILAHKFWSVVLIMVIIGGGYYWYKSASSGVVVTQYVLGEVQKGTIVESISGTGQISSSDQIDITPEVSGQITYIRSDIGGAIKKGGVIAKIDSSDSQISVENAQLNLENAQLAYQQAVKESQDQASGSSLSDLTRAYQNGYQMVANSFLDIPAILDGVNEIFYDTSHSPYFSDSNLVQINEGNVAANYKYQAGITFDKAKNEYNSNFDSYRITSINSDPAVIVALLQQTITTLSDLSAALNGTYNTIDFIKDRITSNVPAQIATDKSNLSSYITKVSGHITDITDALTSIENAKASASNAELKLKQAQLTVSQAQASLKSAQDDLANHTIAAPFDGIIAKIPVEQGDKVNTGISLATLITSQKVAEISLNEVDAVKIKIGQQATLIFDAIPNLSIVGQVEEIDLVGTVSQGIVNYTVKIGFDTSDDRVKPAMTTSANIIVDAKQNVLTVSSSAIKTQGSTNYVEFIGTASSTPSLKLGQPITLSVVPTAKAVQAGISDSNMTEITGGLNEGDVVIVRTVTPSTQTSTTQSSNIRIPGLGGGGFIRGN